MRYIITFFVILLVSAAASVAATIALLPLWSWIEASTGIESVGHSGPAEWCYISTFVAVLSGSIIAVLFLFLRKGRKASG